MEGEVSMPAVRAPLDSSGFVEAFDASDLEGQKKFFDEYGFVVIRDVLSEERVRDSIQEIWAAPNYLGSNLISVKRDDPTTWENGNWPSQMGLAEKGFLTHFADPDMPESWKNRQLPEVHRVFSSILGREDLWVNFDRYGMMRPTKGIKYNDGTVRDKPEWLTKKSWLHWDQNPWREPGFVRVQGLFALSESTESTGGFICVPGFQKRFFDWQKDNEAKQKRGGLIMVPGDDPIQQEPQKITMRKGSLLVWDSRLPHANYPNESDQFRIVQYCTFFPCDEENTKERNSRLDVFHIRMSTSEHYDLPQLTELGEKMLGARSWKTGEKYPYQY